MSQTEIAEAVVLRSRPSSPPALFSSGPTPVLAVFVAGVVIGAMGLLALALGPTGLGLPKGATSPGPPSSAPPPPDYVDGTINGGCAWGNAPINGSDQYTPANFTVPAHTLIILTITNYDNGQNPVLPGFEQVSGVLGNVEYANATPPLSWGTPTSAVSISDVSHTFTVMPNTYGGLPGGLNVPVPASEGPSGSSVTVELYLNATGQVSWNCMAPCDTWSMQTPGFMAGTITVV